MSAKNTALILVAGGSGTRMGGDLPKQYIELNGCEIIEHTMRAFCNSHVVGKIIIVCAKDYTLHIQTLAQKLETDIPFVITEGGTTRQDSVQNGLKLASDCEFVMIHDAVRCCITPYEISKLADTLWQGKSCALGVRVKDTIKRAASDNQIIETVNRDGLWHIQTPQAFVTSEVVSAHEIARKSGFVATDDCAVAENAGMSVTIVEGNDTNIKVTTPVDLLIASEILKGRSQ